MGTHLHVIISGLFFAALTLGLAAPVAADPTLPDGDAQNPAIIVDVMPHRCTDGFSIPARPGPCRLTPKRKHRPTVVLWGDSHTWQHIPGLRAEAAAQRVNLVAFVMGACPPMDLPKPRPRGACTTNAVAALDHVKRLRKRHADVRVVIGAHWQFYRGLNEQLSDGWVPEPGSDLFRAGQARLFALGTERVFTTLGRLRVRTAVIGQAPWVPADPGECAAGALPYRCDLLRSEAIPGEDDVRVWLAQRMRSLQRPWYVDVASQLCDLTVCHARLGETDVFLDDLHLNPAVSQQLRASYRPFLRARG